MEVDPRGVPLVEEDVVPARPRVALEELHLRLGAVLDLAGGHGWERKVGCSCGLGETAHGMLDSSWRWPRWDFPDAK